MAFGWGVSTFAIDIQIPAERVFEVGFGGPNIFSGGVWMSRAGRDDIKKGLGVHIFVYFLW